MSQRLTHARWPGLIAGMVVLAAWGLFLARQMDELRAYPWQITPLALAWGVGWGALYFGGLAFCWALLLRQVVGTGRVMPAAQVWLLSMMTRYIPGNVWHILSRVALAHRLGVSRMHVLSSASIEQVLTLLGALALVAVTLPFWSATGDWPIWWLWLLPIGLLLLHPRVLGTMLRWLAQRVKRPELAWQYTGYQIIALVLAYLGVMMLAGVALLAVLGGMTLVHMHDIPLILGASALGWATGYLSLLTPSGLGVREAVITALLALIYPLPVATVSSLLFRVVLTLGELLAVVLAWIAAGGKPVTIPTTVAEPEDTQSL
ncbi:MAG: hypothetical protein HC837_08945 [Chloroflexaceae bacterium]|nr:hypothetical protein [Chloroflexaceae bacterium]